MIDPRAIVHADAEIGEGVCIGPWSVIGPNVRIGAGTWIGPHVVIRGPTHIGNENRIFQFCSIGDDPQDKKYGGEPEPYLEIGDRNTIREYCTLNRGTVRDGATRIGNDNWIMAYVHVAHDCVVGNHTVFANNASIAGHVIVGDFATLGGFTGVHQFCRIGAYSFSAISTVVTKDVPPFIMVSQNPAEAHGVNKEGLKRAGFSQETIDILRKAYKMIYRHNLTLTESVERLQKLAEHSREVESLIGFIQQSSRGIVR